MMDLRQSLGVVSRAAHAIAQVNDEAPVPGGVLCLLIFSYDVTYDNCLHNNMRILVVQSLHDGLETVFGAVSRAAHAIAQVHDEAPVLGSILLIRDSL